MFKKYQQASLVDFLLDIMPGLSDRPGHVEKGAADDLFALWKKNKKVSNNVYKKPEDMKQATLDNMKKEGLVRQIGDKLGITSKGSEIIKTMILGDDTSSFEEDKEITYKQAKSNIKRKLKNKKQQTEDNWWGRF